MSLTRSELLLLALSSSVWWHSIRCIGKYNVAQTTHFVQCKDCELESLSAGGAAAYACRRAKQITHCYSSRANRMLFVIPRHIVFECRYKYILCYYWQKNEEWILSSVFEISIFSLQFHLQTAIFISAPEIDWLILCNTIHLTQSVTLSCVCLWPKNEGNVLNSNDKLENYSSK